MKNSYKFAYEVKDGGFRILKQPESMRSVGLIYTSSDRKVFFESRTCPEIEAGTVFLRGDNYNRDHSIVPNHHFSNSALKKYLQEFQKWVETSNYK